ncbi:MAG: hypothetical protein SFV22_19805 [Saprospiraceae bacterium]|nr:hypothetical protein [Saprospiraceae bacterium]
MTNVLGFWIYGYAAFQICRILFPRLHWVMPGLFALFLLNPFLLDFFSLCRGYGLSTSLILLSCLFVLQGFSRQSSNAIWRALIASMLAAYANFTALVFWAAVSLLVLIYFLQFEREYRNKRRALFFLGVASAIYLSLIYTPLHKMQSTNQFKYWQSDGFFNETIISLVDNSMYGSKMIDVPFEYLGMAAILFFFSLGAYVFYFWGRYGRASVLQSPGFVAFGLLGLTSLINIMQTVLLKTPNLTNRTALLLYPLFVLCVGAALQIVTNMRPRTGHLLSFLIGVLAVYHLARSYQPRRVREWWYDENTFEVLDYVKNQQQQGAATPLAVDWHFHRSFDFYVKTGHASHIRLAPSQPQLDSTNSTTYAYIFDSEYEKFKNRYDVVLKFDGGARMLLRIKPEHEAPLAAPSM